jgi:hypothetical protein
MSAKKPGFYEKSRNVDERTLRRNPVSNTYA